MHLSILLDLFVSHRPALPLVRGIPHRTAPQQLFSPYGGPQRARPRLPLHSEAKGRKLWELGERIARPHLERHGFLAEAWPPVFGATGGEGMEPPAVPKRGGLWALPVLHARKGEKAVAQ